jgi:hypothetical protein
VVAIRLRNLLDRLTRAGIAHSEQRGAHGKRLLVIGEVVP